jgi:hypothetical protein
MPLNVAPENGARSAIRLPLTSPRLNGDSMGELTLQQTIRGTRAD